MAQIYFLIKNNQLVQDSFSGFFYSLVSLLYIARSRRLYILGKLYNFRLLLIKKIINPPHFRHKPSKKKKEKKRKRRNYIHVFTCNYLRNSKYNMYMARKHWSRTGYDNYRGTFVFEMQFQSCVPKLFVDFMVKLFIIATH